MQTGLRLQRSGRDEMVAGVMGGLAEFFGLDSGKLRLGYVIASIVSGAFPGLALYFLLWYVMPRDEY